MMSNLCGKRIMLDYDDTGESYEGLMLPLVDDGFRIFSNYKGFDGSRPADGDMHGFKYSFRAWGTYAQIIHRYTIRAAASKGVNL